MKGESTDEYRKGRVFPPPPHRVRTHFTTLSATPRCDGGRKCFFCFLHFSVAALAEGLAVGQDESGAGEERIV